uniref:Uncharacterized protein n=1 Tax=Pavo cristatus TaxID=9049 RepID=A0A8C9F571_PAVCR
TIPWQQQTAAFSTNLIPLLAFLAALDTSITKSRDSLHVKGTRLLEEAHFCCGARGHGNTKPVCKRNQQLGKSHFWFIDHSHWEEEAKPSQLVPKSQAGGCREEQIRRQTEIYPLKSQTVSFPLHCSSS